jgi:phage gp36-like protein
MRKIFAYIIALCAFAVTVSASTRAEKEDGVGYCARSDLEQTYGEDRIAAWSRFDGEAVTRAIAGASAEIDGYLLSGGYDAPLAGTPATLRKYCVDIVCAGLVLSAGVLDEDPGGKAVIEQAKVARRYLEKVAEGRFKVPGYSADGGEAPPSGVGSGGVKVAARPRMGLKGY